MLLTKRLQYCKLQIRNIAVAVQAVIYDKYFSKTKLASLVEEEFKLVTEDEIRKEISKLRKLNNKNDNKKKVTKAERSEALASIKSGIKFQKGIRNVCNLFKRLWPFIRITKIK